MPLDVLEPDLSRNDVDCRAFRRIDAQGLTFDFIVKVLQRDDPLRRAYLQRRWRVGPASVSYSRELPGCYLNYTSLSRISRSRR
jgi:hypothetical protein